MNSIFFKFYHKGKREIISTTRISDGKHEMCFNLIGNIVCFPGKKFISKSVRRESIRGNIANDKYFRRNVPRYKRIDSKLPVDHHICIKFMVMPIKLYLFCINVGSLGMAKTGGTVSKTRKKRSTVDKIWKDGKNSNQVFRVSFKDTLGYSVAVCHKSCAKNVK